MLKLLALNLLLVGSVRLLPADNNIKLDLSRINDKVIEQQNEMLSEVITTINLTKQEQVEQLPNLLCSSNKYITYTNIDTINLNWDYIELNDYYIDNKGMVREVGTGAIACAMGTQFSKGGYYNIILNNGMEILVKVVDTKADAHTTNACYTTHDNSILELWLTNANHDLRYLGNSKIKNIFITEIKAKK